MLTNVHCPDSFRRNFCPMSSFNHLPKQSEICYAILNSLFGITKEQEIVPQILAKPKNFSDGEMQSVRPWKCLWLFDQDWF